MDADIVDLLLRVSNSRDQCGTQRTVDEKTDFRGQFDVWF